MRHTRRSGVGQVARGLLLSLLVVQSRAALADDLVPASGPMRANPIPVPQRYDSLVEAEGGARAYVSEQFDAVNLWAVAVSHWPALLAGLGGLASLVALGVIWRRAKAAQSTGYRYCRRCGYCLEGSSLERCPECGDEQPALRIVIGRSRWRRARFTVALIALYWSGYLAMHIVHVPQAIDLAKEEWGWSRDLAAWAERHRNTGFKDFTAKVGRIEVIDIGAGRVLNQMLTRPAWYYFTSNCLAPDGRTLFVWERANNELLVVQPAAARVLDRQKLSSRGVMSLDGFSADGRTAYYSWIDSGAGRSHLMAWHLASHATSSAFQLEIAQRGDVFQRVPSSDSLVLGRLNCGRFALYDLSLYDLAKPKEPICKWEKTEYLNYPLLGATERYMYLLQPKAPLSGCPPVPGTVTKWSLDTGALVYEFPTLAAVPWDRPVPCEYDGQRDRIFVATNGDPAVIHVGDCRRGEWVHELRCRPQDVIRKISLMPKARLLFAQVDLISATTVGNTRYEKFLGSQILAFDLRALDQPDSGGK